MIPRTPRRRISPRTKRRYRAIKDFFRKTLGTSSQRDIKTTSSIGVSVSDLKNKIDGIEQQLNKVSKHCRDLACLEHSFRKEKDHSFVQLQGDEEIANEQEKCDRTERESATKLLYKTSHSQYQRSESDYDHYKRKHKNDNNMTSTSRAIFNDSYNFELKPENNYTNLLKRHRSAQQKYQEQTSIFSTSSCYSLLESRNERRQTDHRHQKRQTKKEYTEPLILKNQKDFIVNDIKNRDRNYDARHNRRTTKEYSKIDKEFISDIIRRQYKPVRLFGRRDSDFSQFSAPVCRDQEFIIRDDIQEDSELCSCCFDKHRRHKQHYIRNADLSDMRSICDTRLYSSKKRKRNKDTRQYLKGYNDSTQYDIVPVKERSSPKARKKFSENNTIPCQYYKEVPPSPKSQRPRLNLKVQHYEDTSIHKRKKSPLRDNQKKVVSITESDVSSVSRNKKTLYNSINVKSQKPLQVQEDVAMMSSLQYPIFINEQTNMSSKDITLNTQETNSTAEKTDKTLCEIKDILQSFLQEIKKETTRSEQSDNTSKVEIKQAAHNQENFKINAGLLPNSGHSFNNYTVNPYSMSPFLQTIPNPCCYPILPMCPMNCVQNGYIMPSPSYTCNLCTKKSKEPCCSDPDSCYNKNKTCEDTNMNDETQKLIKEIHKFVSQKPKSAQVKDECNNEKSVNKLKNEQLRYDKKFLTSRSVGDSIKGSKHDANVGTPNMRCYSKSCEAIGIRNASDIYNTTNGSYSDTILEKLSQEATQSSSESAISVDVLKDKVQHSKFKNVLRKLRIFKKKRKDVIEEVSETESTIEVEVNPKPPFNQHIIDYSMHGEEYFHPPPIPEQHCCCPRSDFYRHGCNTTYDKPPPLHDYYDHRHNHNKAASPHYDLGKYTTTPSYPHYDPHCNQIPPQVPLCLKEIEVKSIGTQSERKVSILQKLTQKVQPPQQMEAQQRSPLPTKEKPTFWKTLQEKAKQNNPDALDFSLKTQKKLAQGDMKMRNAMMKKLFYKRNPFSPRNLIIKTLLGKDKSSFGDPPKMYRPRMFL